MRPSAGMVFDVDACGHLEHSSRAMGSKAENMACVHRGCSEYVERLARNWLFEALRIAATSSEGRSSKSARKAELYFETSMAVLGCYDAKLESIGIVQYQHTPRCGLQSKKNSGVKSGAVS